MSELTVAPAVAEGTRPAVGGTLVTMAWRNLWRVRRRTWLTAGGVGFAVFFIVMHRSIAVGAFDTTIELATEQLSGHAQVQHAEYLDDPRMRFTVEGLAAVTETLERHPAVVAVAPRGTSFALVSADAEAGETSFGAQVMGIDPAVEFATLAKDTLPGGRPLERTGEGLLGSVLARNLGAEMGGDIIVLGTEKDGGVAATAVTLVGLFESGNPELDRSLMMVHFDDFSEAFGLHDEAHTIAVLTRDAGAARDFAAEVAPSIEVAPSVQIAESAAGTGAARVRPWQDVQPELEQFVVMKLGGAYVIYVILVVILAFMVVNTFVMTVYERQAEFGMLKAIGMPPGAIFRMVQFEGLWMGLLGAALGVAVAAALVAALSVQGIPLGAILEGMEDMLGRLSLPDALIPVFDPAAAVVATVTMLVAIQVAVLVPAPRIWRLNAVEALRDEE